MSPEFPVTYTYRAKFSLFYASLFFIGGGAFMLSELLRKDYSFEVSVIKLNGTAGLLAKAILGAFVFLAGIFVLVLMIRERMNNRPVILGAHSISIPNQLGRVMIVIPYRDIEKINVSNVCGGTSLVITTTRGRTSQLSGNCFASKSHFDEIIRTIEKQVETCKAS